MHGSIRLPLQQWNLSGYLGDTRTSYSSVAEV
jgi:hypothetical protein